MKRSILFFLVFSFGLNAQDDLLDMIEDDNLNSEPVFATFKASRIVNSQSIELPRPGTLEFMILHRFGSMSDGFYDLYGMDEAVIRFDLKYGLNDFLAFGLGRSSMNKTYDVFSKVKLLRQKQGGSSTPISLAIFTKCEIQTVVKEMDITDRLTFDIQALIARKFSRSLSLQVMPTLIHRNLVLDRDDSNDVFSIGLGGRMKLTKRTSINLDTFFPIGDRSGSFKQGWGLGYDIETGGHVFQVMVTNAQGSFESEYIENAKGEFENFELFIGFNISRVFSI